MQVFESVARCRFWVLTSCTLLLFGCNPYYVVDDVDVEDHNVPSVNARVIVRPESMVFSRRGAAGRGGFEIDYERYRGRSTQQFGEFHYLSLDEGDIFGPGEVNNAVDLRHARLAYNHLFRFGRYFELEPAMGLGLESTKLVTQSTAPGSRAFVSKQDDLSLAFTVTPRWNFNKYVAIETRVDVGADFVGGRYLADTASLVFQPVYNLAIKAGYQWRTQEVTLTGDSDLEMDFSGFNATVVVVF